MDVLIINYKLAAFRVDYLYFAVTQNSGLNNIGVGSKTGILPVHQDLFLSNERHNTVRNSILSENDKIEFPDSDKKKTKASNSGGKIKQNEL